MNKARKALFVTPCIGASINGRQSGFHGSFTMWRPVLIFQWKANKLQCAAIIAEISVIENNILPDRETD
jgi:hypothetical protein